MKTILFSALLALGAILATGGNQGGGTNAPKGGILDIASNQTGGNQGGGTNAPKGGILDIA